MTRINLELLVGVVSAFLFLGFWYWLTQKIIRKLPVEGKEMKLNPIEHFEHKDGCEAYGFRSHRNIKYLQSRGLCICEPLLEWNEPMVGKVINYRYGMGSSEGFVVPVLHNWDRETFDKHGYPVATCGSRLYPRQAELVPVSNKTTCKDCFK